MKYRIEFMDGSVKTITADRVVVPRVVTSKELLGLRVHQEYEFWLDDHEKNVSRCCLAINPLCVALVREEPLEGFDS